MCHIDLFSDYQQEEVKMDDINVMKTAIDTYGPRLQTVVAIEELSELQKELTKFLRGGGNKKHLTEEMADVLIMVTQLQLIYHVGDEDIREVMDYKLKRLEERIKKND